MRRWEVIAIAILGLAFLSGEANSRRGPTPSDEAVRSASLTATAEALAHAVAVEEAFEELAWRHTGLADRDVHAVAEAIIVESKRQRLDWRLAMAVIQVESGGYNFAKSHVGALGLMQIMPHTGLYLAAKEEIPWRGPDMLLDPAVNVRLGISYLRELSDRYDGSWKLALAAYNWGPARIDGFIRRGARLPELYVTQVMKEHTDFAATDGRS